MFRPDLFVHGAVWRFLAVDDVAFDLPPPGDPAWDGFSAHVRVLNWRVCRAMAVIVAGMALFGGATDFILVAHDPPLHSMLIVLRTGTVAICAAMFVTLQFLPLARRHPLWGSLPFTVSVVAFAGRTLGSTGGVEKQLFDFLMFAIVPTVVAPAPILWRAGYLVALVAAMTLGFFAPYPGHWAHPFAAPSVAFVASMAGMLVVIGHLVYVATCRSYFQGRAIERAAADLKAFNAGLEQQVADKTKALRRLYEDLQQVREDERARLSRELHDELGQQLSAIHYVLAKAKLRSERNPASTKASLDELSTLLQRAAETTREIARELRPPLLEQYGFVPACEWMARDVTERAGLGCAFNVSSAEGVTCPEPVAVAAYRVLQEALNNIGRHAQATSTQVSLSVRADAVELSVLDDGVGLPEPGERGDGLGLLGMEQRVLSLGGTFSAEALPGRGSAIRARLPFEATSTTDD